MRESLERSNFQRFDEPVTVIFRRNASAVFYLFNCTLFICVFITKYYSLVRQIIRNAAIHNIEKPRLLCYTKYKVYMVSTYTPLSLAVGNRKKAGKIHGKQKATLRVSIKVLIFTKYE